MILYFHVDYEQVDEVPADYGRFHCWWNRENPCTPVKHSGEELNTTGDDKRAHEAKNVPLKIYIKGELKSLDEVKKIVGG